MHAIAYTIVIILTVALPLVVAVWLRRRFRVSWFFFGVGALTFIGSQVVHLPLNEFLGKVGILPAAPEGGWQITQMAIIAGLTAGVCEELARTVGYALLKRARKLENGLMLGIGHGGTEAMILMCILTAGTVVQLFMLRGVDLSTMDFSAQQLAYIAEQMKMFEQTPLQAVLPMLERMIAMTFHVILSLMVLYAFQKRNAMWVVAAILYHAIVDMVAVLLHFQAVNNWLLETLFFAMLIPGVLWAFFTFRPQWRTSVLKRVPVEWGLFWQSLRKELIQLWRTKMVLVVVGVFALFGMMSPLLAYFTPQIIGSIEGAEMFKDLIPTPSAKDAMDQFVKNLSQFGFLIAILVGMGRVAGEKEKGITEMILHKPLPRWAYILSKFVAQMLVFLAGFIIAEILGYVYTIYLFGEVSLGVFTLINLLLFIWLMCFSAVTLLGSTVTRSIGAAAGVSLAGAVVIMVTGQIPQYGMISPQALMGWAAAISAEQAVLLQSSNFTALGTSVVLIILLLIWSVGLFERQEI
jgi:uncharacterized membrane protein YhfC/ABC-type transport system involved in multi-copper enzyme maturation permease subunit